jgi:hypothetical protein
MQYQLLMAMLSLNHFISHLNASHLRAEYRLGFENTSPDNTWVLRSTGDDPDYIITHYSLVLPPSQQEWLEPSNTTKNFIYQVCDTSGEAAILYTNGLLPMCAVYSGATINITITPLSITARAVENTAIKKIEVSGDASPYAISATTLPPPECELPTPMQYADEKWRIVNLEGATLFEPQFPHACDVLYFANLGVNTVRLPFKWDYIQTFLSQDIPINWAPGGYGAQMIKLTHAWTEKNYTVILSMYDRMRYSYCAIGASDCWVSQERYASVWQDIAAQLMNNSRVVFGLMNNPDVYDIIDGKNNGTTIVLNNQNAAAKAIRALGAKQLILYSGNGGSNIATWNETYYGESNTKTFVPENITDNYYQIDTQIFYETPGTLPETGCIASAINNPQACIDRQNPDNFMQYMRDTGIHIITGKTGGTNSSECIICINQGTTWMLLQNNITGIGMWVGGHAWLSVNGSTNYPLYLAPIQHVPQKQMTLGFQNVSNPQTGEPFLITLDSAVPSLMPTQIPNNIHHATDYLSMPFICAYAATTGTLLAVLFLIGRYKNSNNCYAIGKNWCGLFKQDPSINALLLNNDHKNSRKN